MEENEQLMEEVCEKVRGYLQEVYPDFVEFETGRYTMQEGSATISVTVRPWHENDIAVEFTSQLVSGANITPELMQWLLETNVDLHFGAFGLLFDGTIVYSQTLPGSDLSRQEFESTARTVAAIADHYDDEIVAMAGGSLGNAAASSAVEEMADANEA